MFPWLVARNRNSLDPFEPIYIVSLFWLFYYFIGPLYWQLNGFTHPFGLKATDSAWIVALILSAMGMSAFLFGYYHKVGKVIGKLGNRLPLGFYYRFGYIFPAIYILICVNRLYLIANGWYFFADTSKEVPGGWVSVLLFADSISVLVYALLCMMMFERFHKQRLYIMVIVVIVVIEAAFAFIKGYRSMILAVVSVPFIVQWYLRGYLPSKALLVSAFLFISFVFLPLNTIYRLATINETGKSVDPASEVATVFAQGAEILTENPSLLVPFIADNPDGANFIVRLEGVSTLAALVDRLEDHDLLLGETLKWPILIMIPNILWPEKSEAYRLRQDEFCNYVDIVFRPCPVVMTQMGELYYNFWMVGILVGMFLFGVVYKAFYVYCIKYSTNVPFGIFLYAAFYYRLIFAIEGGIIGQAPAVSRQVIFALLVGYLFYVLRKSSRAFHRDI